MNRFILFMILINMVVSCETSVLKPIDYMKWVRNKDNNLIKKIEMGDIIYEMQYKPSDYIIALEEKKNSINRSLVLKRRKMLENAYYFNLNIKPKNGQTEVLYIGLENNEDYNSRLNYASYDFQNQIFLIEDGDTLPCTQYHFEQKYGLGVSANILLGFEKRKKKLSKDKIIVINDNLLNGGIISFRFDYTDIKNTPKMLTK